MSSKNPTPPESIEQRIAAGLERLAQALRSHTWQDGLPRGLTPTQGRLLALLADRPGASLGELADQLGVRPATASEAVRALVDKQWVSKNRHPEDRRTLWLQLTADGRQLAAEAGRWPGLLAAAAGSLDADEKRILLGALLRMIRSLQQQGRIAVTRMCLTCRYFRPDVHDDEESPHHCAFVDAPFGDADLRVDCGDHEAMTSSSPSPRH